MSMTVEALAKIIHNIPLWDCYETPHAQAEALLPYIEHHIAAGQQGATNPAAEAIQYHNAVGPIDAMAAAFSAMDNSDTALEEWPQRAIDALAFAGWAVVPYALPYEVLGEAGISGVFETGNPKHGWDWLVAKTRIGPHGPPAATPQPPKPAGAVPLPEDIAELADDEGPLACAELHLRMTTLGCPDVDDGSLADGLRDARRDLKAYGDAREAAAQSIPRDLWDWLAARDLLPDTEDDGTVEWANVMQSLQAHEDALLSPIGAGRADAVPSEDYQKGWADGMQEATEILTAPQQMTAQGEAVGVIRLDPRPADVPASIWVDREVEWIVPLADLPVGTKLYTGSQP